MFSYYVLAFYVTLVIIKPTRKLAIALAPWLVFACSYDCMRLLPNYEVTFPIDIKGLYETEKQLFGIVVAGQRMTPNEFFALHHCAFADILAGIFYLCWVPVPLLFGLYLYIKGDKKNYLRFSLAFLFVNLIGFFIYYLHPAAPPWYVMNYGFEPLPDTPGNVAGLGRFDSLTGVPVFQSLYSSNSNVFAAVPSLHAAYMAIATAYAIISKQKKPVVGLFAIICAGIWWTAVYSGHHYIIDVLLGIGVTLFGIISLEMALAKLPRISGWFDRYVSTIS